MAEDGDPLVGRTLGGYRVEFLLNRGPRFSVYRAVQLSVSRRVAIKVARSSSNPERKELLQFIEKARFAACRTHPCIVQLHDVCRETDSLFYSMEFLPGGTLAELVSRKGAVASQAAIRLLRDGASALLFAEEEGIVHGDLNPTHLLFTEEGSLKLLNLGLTRDPWLRGEKPEQPGPLSLNFASPEQLRSERPDPRSDIYGLGYSFYYAISARLPFEGKSPSEISEGKVATKPARLRAPSDKVPVWLCDLIGSMTHPDPAQRPRSAAEVIEAINCNSVDLRFHGDRQPARFARRTADRPAPRVPVMPCAILLALFAILACFFDPPPRDLAQRVQPPPPETAWIPVEPPVPPEAPVQPFSKEFTAPVQPAPPAAELDPGFLDAIKDAIEEAQLTRELAPALNTADRLAAEGNYREALQHLRDLHHPQAPEIQKKQKAVTEAARQALASAVAEARSLAEKSAFAEAGILEKLAGRMPDELRPDLEREIRRLLENEASLAAAELEALERAANSVWKAVGALDFDAAEKALEDATRNPSKAGSDRAEQLRKELGPCRGAWEKLVSAVKAAITEKEPFPVERSDPTGLHFPWILKKCEVSGGKVRLAVERGQSIEDVCDLLDLAPRTLVALMRRIHDAKGDEEIPVPVVEGLCRLVRHARGPARAWQLLSELPVPQSMESLREEYRKAGEAELASAAARQRQNLETLQGRSPNPPEADWIGLIQDLEALVATHRKLPAYGKHRKELRKVHGEACMERALVGDQGAMLATYFHGRMSRTRNGVRVTYDAKSPEQLEDFVVVLGDKPVIERGAILLCGEYRLLHGNPFRSRLGLEARVADYDPKAPNLNVALWTHDGDRVTPEPLEPPDRRSARLVDREPKKGPGDFFVFGVGHAPRAKNPAQFWEVGRQDLILPCFVVLSGGHGSNRGKNQEGLTQLWSTQIWKPLEGKLRAHRILLELEPDGSFQWNIDGRECHNPTEDRNPMWRDLLVKPDSEGSLSLFTNLSKVWYSEIAIEGEINTKWLGSEAKRRGKVRFDSLERGSSIEPLTQQAR